MTTVAPPDDLSTLLAALPHDDLVRCVLAVSANFPALEESIRERVAALPTTSVRKLFVRNLAQNTTSENVYDTFAVYGLIEEAVVIVDPQSQRSKQYAFVIFRDLESTMRALADKAITVMGRLCEVSVALPASTKHGATPGGGGAGVPNYISPTSSIKNYQTPLLSPTLYSPHDPLVRSGSNIYPVPFSASANYNGNIPANLPLGSTPYSPIFQQPPMQNHMAQQQQHFQQPRTHQYQHVNSSGGISGGAAGGYGSGVINNSGVVSQYMSLQQMQSRSRPSPYQPYAPVRSSPPPPTVMSMTQQQPIYNPNNMSYQPQQYQLQYQQQQSDEAMARMHAEFQMLNYGANGGAVGGGATGGGALGALDGTELYNAGDVRPQEGPWAQASDEELQRALAQYIPRR